MADFELDRAGIGRILKGASVRGLVNGAAKKVAGQAEALSEFPIETNSYTTDRAAASVVIAHPAGAADQAKNGTLTKAASAAGLDVRPQ